MTKISSFLLVFFFFIVSGCSNQIGGFRFAEPEEPETELPPESGDQVGGLRLGDHFYVSSALETVFGTGPVATAIIEEEIKAQKNAFGGACDPFEVPSTRTFNGAGVSTSYTPSCLNESSTSLPAIPKNSPTREAFRMRACLRLSDSAAVVDAILKIKNRTLPLVASDLTPMTEGDIRKAYQAFYFPAEPLPETLEALKAVVNRAEQLYSEFGEAQMSFESWKMIFLSLCSSPDWQAL